MIKTRLHEHVGSKGKEYKRIRRLARDNAYPGAYKDEDSNEWLFEEPVVSTEELDRRLTVLTGQFVGALTNVTTKMTQEITTLQEYVVALTQQNAQNAAETELVELAHVPAFIDAYCVLAPMVDIPSALLQQAYEAWCVETNQIPHPWATEVGPVLKELGLTTKQMRRGGPQRKHWLGITLNEAGLSMVRDGA